MANPMLHFVLRLVGNMIQAIWIVSFASLYGKKKLELSSLTYDWLAYVQSKNI